MNLPGRRTIKTILGEIPLTAELYWLLRNRRAGMPGRFKLNGLQAALPEAIRQTTPYAQAAAAMPAQDVAIKDVFIFATLHYWIEHAALMGLALAGQGHKVTLGYLPYGEWSKPINKFDLRRQNAYARSVLQESAPLLKTVSLLEVHPVGKAFPEALLRLVEHVSDYDFQYTMQVETVDRASKLYKLRYERNLAAARSAFTWLSAHRPDVVIVPNGTIQEFGVVYGVARHLGIPVTTYEFGDQRERIWLAQNEEIMRQDTSALWQARRDLPVDEGEMQRLRDLFAARQKGALWENFARLWQGVPAGGGQQARAALGLDVRPVVLLATNVLGDSLTLGRQVFSASMAEWIERTVRYFAGRPDVQLVVRVHPGEALMHGTSMLDVIRGVLPELPVHIHVIAPKEKVNTYDLVEVADLGLVYTTTVGMEMAMNGVPVIVAGRTHYRERGFTHDPESWEAYFDTLDRLLARLEANPAAQRLTREQVSLAWQYAYRFFFEYPHVYPWHLVKMWEDYQARPLAYVLGDGRQRYAAAFRYLLGSPLDWGSF